MTTYKITIKDNSIPEHMKLAIPNYIDTYTAIIEHNYNHNNHDYYTKLMTLITELMEEYALDLNTDPESLEILSIIKQ